MMME
jgi:hypothetical protein